MTGTSGPRTGRVRGLIVDDEPALDEVLSVAVTEAGRRPCPALDGQSAPKTARGCAPHAVVLDGLQVLPRLRHENPRPPALMLTARHALEHGRADGGGNLVEVHISCLRRKIDRGRTPVFHTVRGLGYAIRSAEDGR